MVCAAQQLHGSAAMELSGHPTAREKNARHPPTVLISDSDLTNVLLSVHLLPAVLNCVHYTALTVTSERAS